MQLSLYRCIYTSTRDLLPHPDQVVCCASNTCHWRLKQQPSKQHNTHACGNIKPYTACRGITGCMYMSRHFRLSTFVHRFADDSYDRSLYPAGSCAKIGSGTPTGPNGTECLFSETQDYETFRCSQIPCPKHASFCVHPNTFCSCPTRHKAGLLADVVLTKG